MEELILFAGLVGMSLAVYVLPVLAALIIAIVFWRKWAKKAPVEKRKKVNRIILCCCGVALILFGLWFGFLYWQSTELNGELLSDRSFEAEIVSVSGNYVTAISQDYVMQDVRKGWGEFRREEILPGDLFKAYTITSNKKLAAGDKIVISWMGDIQETEPLSLPYAFIRKME